MLLNYYILDDCDLVDSFNSTNYPQPYENGVNQCWKYEAGEGEVREYEKFDSRYFIHGYISVSP